MVVLFGWNLTQKLLFYYYFEKWKYFHCFPDWITWNQYQFWREGMSFMNLLWKDWEDRKDNYPFVWEETFYNSSLLHRLIPKPCLKLIGDQDLSLKTIDTFPSVAVSFANNPNFFHFQNCQQVPSKQKNSKIIKSLMTKSQRAYVPQTRRQLTTTQGKCHHFSFVLLSNFSDLQRDKLFIFLQH